MSLWELTIKDREWNWGEQQRRDFKEVNRELSSAQILAKFQLGVRHRVTADASKHILGAALLQDIGGSHWGPVAHPSRVMLEAE